MTQINFRVKEPERAIIKTLAELRGISVAEFAKLSVLKEISIQRVDMAFSLLAKGKIGRKRAWILSGLSNLEFLNEWTLRHAEEKIPEGIMTTALESAMQVNLKEYLEK
ncbi:MAG: hypothetical protein ACTSRK_11710 [Promethearchaeota archaeon]